MRHTFRSTQFVPYPLELVFSLLANPETLPPLMPKWQKARIEEASFAPPPPRPPGSPRSAAPAAGAGSTMTISFRPFPLCPIRVPWDAVIEEFVWNDHFCDRQTRGPFAYWRHCHRVAQAAESGMPGTSVTDEVTYELPLGALGELGHSLIIRRQLESTFAYRQQRFVEMLERFASL